MLLGETSPASLTASRACCFNHLARHRVCLRLWILSSHTCNTGYSSPTVTGIDCDRQNQNCRNKYQGGGETGSSYIGRKDREERIRKLRSERFDLVRQYDRLAEEYNKILEGK